MRIYQTVNTHHVACRCAEHALYTLTAAAGERCMAFLSGALGHVNDCVMPPAVPGNNMASSRQLSFEAAQVFPS